MLFVGDDWAEDHHDIEIVDQDGRRLIRARLPEGMEGITRLHALVTEHAPASWAELAPEQAAGNVVVGIETDRGPWVAALRAAGYLVFAINPLSAARYRQRHSTSGAKSDVGDAHVLAEIVRLDREHHRPVAGDSDLVDAIKLVARAHQTSGMGADPACVADAIHPAGVLSRCRRGIPGFSGPGHAFLAGAGTEPGPGSETDPGQLVAALRAARRHHVEAKAEVLLAVLRAPALRQPAITQGAYAAVVTGQVGIITALNEQIKQLGQVVDEHFGRHPAADIYLSQPGLGVVLAARTLGEFGDDTGRFVNARARKNYSGQSPITRASGKKSVVLARYATNRRLGAALHLQAFAALGASPGARAYYDALRGRNIGHHAALRQLANRLVGILHGCLKTNTLYNEDTAWQHHRADVQHVAA